MARDEVRRGFRDSQVQLYAWFTSLQWRAEARPGKPHLQLSPKATALLAYLGRRLRRGRHGAGRWG